MPAERLKYCPIKYRGNPSVFTALGNHYDLAIPESIAYLRQMLDKACARDRKTGYEELTAAEQNYREFGDAAPEPF